MLEPIKLPNGFVDENWWNSLTLEQKHKYDVWESDFPEKEKKDSPMEVIIKPEILDTSNVEECKEKDSGFRPTCFDEYIGQDKAKQRIMTYINGCKKFNEHFPHTFLSAPAGCGKTVFANIVANMLHEKFICCTGGDIKTEQQLVDLIVKCNGGILFVDECHRISTKIGTFLLPILEEGKIQGKKIKSFTMIMATTHKGNLSENLSALVQRFLPIELEHYTNNDLVEIIKQFHTKIYSKINIDDNIYHEISRNSKYTPRISLRLLREYVYTEDLDLVKFNNSIIKEGITQNDIKVLKYLNDHGGAGKANLGKFLNVEPKTYEFEIEPYLILKELINVGSKRKITEKGRQFLEVLK